MPRSSSSGRRRRSVPVPVAAPDPRARFASPLEAVEQSFVWLVTEPDPLTINGSDFPGLPAGRVPLHIVRTRLAARRVHTATSDAVWTHLIVRARRTFTIPPGASAATSGSVAASAGRVPVVTALAGDRAAARQAAWTVACAGMALPALVRVATPIAVRHHGHAHDIEAATLAGFLVELHRTDPCVPQIAARLRTAAHRAALRYRDTLTTTPATITTDGTASGATPAGGAR